MQTDTRRKNSKPFGASRHNRSFHHQTKSHGVDKQRIFHSFDGKEERRTDRTFGRNKPKSRAAKKHRKSKRTKNSKMKLPASLMKMIFKKRKKAAGKKRQEYEKRRRQKKGMKLSVPEMN